MLASLEGKLKPESDKYAETANWQEEAMDTLRPIKIRVGLITLTATLIAACSAPEETSEATATESTYNTALNMVDLMVLVLEPASDILWDSGGWVVDASGYEELYPTTDEGWEYVRSQAAIVVESGNLLALPGRAEDNDAWMIYSEGLSEAGMLAMQAAAEQNKDDFFQAGAQLYSVCTACHQAYNPDILNRFDEEAD
ncbi:MAG TPA: hypothetical protein DCM64_06590 [Gammaproteobacteria bacterium]|jgi:hypothetical protein|nr:hypothetical protein [Gammaproteobacteria bacterium]MDP6731389.1 hypothetical protein [Gammaproteobacteria bacterium]HAJ76108.1 hypothetical protein [Gammaproteobacteria bacterium]|tara:strand:+ start:2082 stop:2675 length:594 start_codon:yes stop_codon:yes gene_type:complete